MVNKASLAITKAQHCLNVPEQVCSGGLAHAEQRVRGPGKYSNSDFSSPPPDSLLVRPSQRSQAYVFFFLIKKFLLNKFDSNMV